jgi:osmoprotectant transport system substrate-binding protein
MPVTSRLRPVAFALAAALVAAGCGESGSSNTSGTTGGTGAGGTVASTMVFGAGPECPQRPLCLQGLQQTYGLQFKEVKTLDSGGPLTVAALQKGDIQVGLIFTSDGQIAANGWTLLEDDKKLQPADPVTPVANRALADAYGSQLTTVVDELSAKITTADLVELNKAVDVDKQDSAAAAEAWLKKKNALPASTGAPKAGPTIVVGSANFSESETLGNLYAQALKAAGFTVQTKFKIGTREVYYPALKSGAEVNFMPEYAGTLTTFLDANAATSTDPAKTHDTLVKTLEPEGVTAFASAPAEDKNGFVVTGPTAQKYGLKKLSDLAKPAS